MFRDNGIYICPLMKLAVVRLLTLVTVDSYSDGEKK